MEEFRIRCIVHDKNDVITHVGIGSNKHTVEQVANWIINKKYSFYTEVKGKRAEVVAKRSTTGNLFLQSTSDNVTYNNLDYLDTCPA